MRWREYGSRVSASRRRNSRLKTQGSRLKTQNSRLKTLEQQEETGLREKENKGERVQYIYYEVGGCFGGCRSAFRGWVAD
jgi:hypothetical protein